MYIGKIVQSGSHIIYLCQVYGPHETSPLPTPADYSFGTFVAIEQSSGEYLVGLISNTVLMNPEFGNLGPRLSPQEELTIFSPDYLSEQATLVEITVVGARFPDGRVMQGVPPICASIDDLVRPLSSDEIALFHHPEGRFQLGYIALLLGLQANPLIPSLLLQLMDNLSQRFPEHKRHLAILRSNLAWRSTVMPAS